MYPWITLHKSGMSLCEYTNNISDSCQTRRPLDVNPRCCHEDQIRFMIDEFVSIETYHFWDTFHDENVSYGTSKKKKKKMQKVVERSAVKWKENKSIGIRYLNAISKFLE